MLHEDDPKRIMYNNFRNQFGQDRIVLIAVKVPEIFRKNSLIRLKNSHKYLENEVHHLDEVKSLINARSTRGEGDTLKIDELLKDWPEKDINLKELKEFVERSRYAAEKKLNIVYNS